MRVFPEEGPSFKKVLPPATHPQELSVFLPTEVEVSGKRIRVVVAKVGLDGHDRGAKLVARYLKDAGMEVIYTGQRQTPDQVVATAVQEDADVIGLSFLAGDHMVLVPKIMEKLKEQEMNHVLVLVGGIIMRHHEPELMKLGVAKVFYAGTDPREIVDYVKANVKPYG